MGKRIFEGLGPGTLIPQRGKLPNIDTSIGAEEGFVLSRVDGHTSLEEILLLVPFDEPVTMVILRRLWERGAIEVPGVARSIAPKKERTPEPVPAPQASAATASADLPPEQKTRIDNFFNTLSQRDAFQLLEIERSADAKEVKRAYFKLSKELHPDRFFGRDIGDYREKLNQIFQAVKAAYELLSNKERRAAYEDSTK